MSQVLTRSANALGRRNSGTFNESPLKDLANKAAGTLRRKFSDSALKTPTKAKPESFGKENDVMAMVVEEGHAGSPQPSFGTPTLPRCSAKKSLNFGSSTGAEEALVEMGATYTTNAGPTVLGRQTLLSTALCKAPGARFAAGFHTSAAQTAPLAVSLAATSENAALEEVARRGSEQFATQASLARLKLFEVASQQGAAAQALQNAAEELSNAVESGANAVYASTTLKAVYAGNASTTLKVMDVGNAWLAFLGRLKGVGVTDNTQLQQLFGGYLKVLAEGNAEESIQAMVDLTGQSADVIAAALNVAVGVIGLSVAYAEEAGDVDSIACFKDPGSSAPGSSAHALAVFGPELPEDGFHAVKGKQEEEEAQSDKNLGSNPNRSGGYSLHPQEAFDFASSNAGVSLDGCEAPSEQVGEHSVLPMGEAAAFMSV